MLQACIQVLHRSGLDRLTTTAVADRAGVSVGTLYQYFPNKRALLLAVLKQHLGMVADSVVHAARTSKGLPQRDVVAAVVSAFVSAKFSDAKSSRVLYGVSAELGGPAVVRGSAERARHALEAALADAPDSGDAGVAGDLQIVSSMLISMMIGPVQHALEAGNAAPPPEVLSRELTTAMLGYLTYRKAVDC
jgi:AcrR family transcriptional regulator